MGNNFVKENLKKVEISTHTLTPPKSAVLAVLVVVVGSWCYRVCNGVLWSLCVMLRFVCVWWFDGVSV